MYTQGWALLNVCLIVPVCEMGKSTQTLMDNRSIGSYSRVNSQWREYDMNPFLSDDINNKYSNDECNNAHKTIEGEIESGGERWW